MRFQFYFNIVIYTNQGKIKVISEAQVFIHSNIFHFSILIYVDKIHSNRDTDNPASSGKDTSESLKQKTLWLEQFALDTRHSQCHHDICCP